MRKDRLLQIIEAVEATPDEEFDMELWARKDDCGTVGCAIGNYCLRNPQSELKLEAHDGEPNRFRPVFGEYTDFVAVAYFLEVRIHDATWLFGGSYYFASYPPRKLDVMNRVRQFAEAN